MMLIGTSATPIPSRGTSWCSPRVCDAAGAIVKRIIAVEARRWTSTTRPAPSMWTAKPLDEPYLNEPMGGAPGMGISPP